MASKFFITVFGLIPCFVLAGNRHCEGKYRFHLATGCKMLFQNASTYPSLSEFLPPLQLQTLVNLYQFVDCSFLGLVICGEGFHGSPNFE